MKALFSLRRLALSSAALLWVCLRVGADDFALSVTPSPSPLVVGSNLTYTIDVTNTAGFTLASTLFITNLFPTSAQFVSATNASGFVGGVFTNLGIVLFRLDLDLNPITNGESVRVTFAVRPAAAGSFTNSITVFTVATTNATTNVVTQVASGVADLEAGIVGPPSSILVNDWMTYTLSVTNRGPSAAANVTLSNQFPADVGFISVSPAGQSFTQTNGSLVFSLASLGSGGSARLQVTVQPTNAGALQFIAQASAPGVIDPNSTNNIVTNIFTVSAFGTNQLVAFTSSAQQFNPQTGLMEQTITLSNLGPGQVQSARVNVLGLTNRLFNAVGTNSGNPFVVYAGSLGAGQSVNLLLEYFIPTRLPVPDPTLVALEVPPVNTSTTAHGSFAITLITNLPLGRVMIEFQSVPGRSYTVLYSDNMSFSNALAAQPFIMAPADRVQWIDDGPPKTVSQPMNATSRFYRVVENQ